MAAAGAKDWPHALSLLQAIAENPGFAKLPSDFRHKVLTDTSQVAFFHGPPKVAYGYLVRVTAMPQATYDDWLRFTIAANKLGHTVDAVRGLTLIAQRWPDRLAQVTDDRISDIVRESAHLPRNAEISLLDSLYAAHWTLKWGIEPSSAWRRLTQLALERGRLAEAVEVSGHITDPYDLIAMRVDRRFDAVVARNPERFDIEGAAKQELQHLEEVAAKTPHSLRVRKYVIHTLLYQQRYEAALAAADSILVDVRSTNFPQKLYDDYDEEKSWLLNLRAIALLRLGRWDEAVEELSAASSLLEEYRGNVSQIINLADLYCALARPKEALMALNRLWAPTSSYGSMAVESARFDAATQLADSSQSKRSLAYLHVHRADAPVLYLDALLQVSLLDRAARELMAELRDRDKRTGALLYVQTFAPTLETQRDTELDGRRRVLIARPDVQSAIRRVGRVESYPLEAP